MAILVTGGAGFIGSHIVNDLIALKEKVIVLDDLSGGYKENVNPFAVFIEGSINDKELIHKIFKSYKIDYIYHLAAYAAEGLSHFIKRFNYENNLIGSINLINAAVNHNVKCFVFTSSIAVYGEGQLPMSENNIPIPEDSYGISKYAVEQELRISHTMFGLNYIIFRPHNVYGEFQNIGDKYRNVVGIFMNQIMLNKPLTIFGDGGQTRAFSYIRDVSPIIARSIYDTKVYNNVFNIGADEPISVNDLAKLVAKEFNVQLSVNYLPARNEVIHAYSDHSKVRTYFGYNTKYSAEEGIRLMADWAKKNGSRESKKFGNIEISKNLPRSWRD